MQCLILSSASKAGGQRMHGRGAGRRGSGDGGGSRSLPQTAHLVTEHFDRRRYRQTARAQPQRWPTWRRRWRRCRRSARRSASACPRWRPPRPRPSAASACWRQVQTGACVTLGFQPRCKGACLPQLRPSAHASLLGRRTQSQGALYLQSGLSRGWALVSVSRSRGVTRVCTVYCGLCPGALAAKAVRHRRDPQLQVLLL